MKALADGSPLQVPAELEEQMLMERYHALPRAGGLDRQYVTIHRGIEALNIYRAFTAFVACKKFSELSASDWEYIAPLQKLDPGLMV